MLFTKILIDCDSCDTIGWALQSSYDMEQKRIHFRCSISVGHCCCHCKEAGASHLYTAKLLNGVYFVMLLKWRMFPSFNSTSKSKYLLTPAPPLWMVSIRLGKEVPKSWRAIEIIPDLYHDDELRSSWSKLRSRWPHPCIGDSKLRPQSFSFSKFHFNMITVSTSSHSVYLEDTESSTHHHTPISQSPANINNRMFSIAI